MTSWARAMAFLAAALAICAACGESTQPAEGAAPAALRAAVIFEPPQIRIGERTALEIAVITPPGHRLLAVSPPESVTGLEILGVESLPVEQQPSRWVHRTRVHLRARDVGSFQWPEGGVDISAPDGTRSHLALAPLALEVVSVMPEYPDRVVPFAARRAPPRTGAMGALPAAAAGSLLSLTAVGLVSLARRRKRLRAASAAGDAPGAAPPWTAARGDLERARAASVTDPRAAADATAATLRRYMTQRFRASAVACTTEELEVALPPFAATSRWPVFVSLLRELDAVRFPPQPRDGPRSALASRTEALVARALDLVEESTPPEALR